MRNSKKAQIIGQVFIFIIAAALAALIIAYGYKAITSFTSRTGEIALVNFKTDLQAEIKTIASDFGSVKRLDLTMPGDYEMLCLLDISKKGQAQGSCLCRRCAGIQAKDYQPEVCDEWENPAFPEPNNAFLIPITPLKLSTMEINNGYVCIKPKGNRISLRLEGVGGKTKVSEWV